MLVGRCLPPTCFHINCRGLSSNWESFRSLLCDMHGEKFSFDVIGVTEVYRCDFDTRLTLPGYHDLITRVREDGSRGGVGLFIKNEINYKIRDDLSVFIPHVFESLFIEIGSKSDHKRSIIGVIYRPNTAPKADIDIFSSTLFDIMDSINNEHTVQITFIFIDFRVCDFAFAFKTQNAPCVSRFKRVLFSDRFQFAFKT